MDMHDKSDATQDQDYLQEEENKSVWETYERTKSAFVVNEREIDGSYRSIKIGFTLAEVKTFLETMGEIVSQSRCSYLTAYVTVADARVPEGKRFFTVKETEIL